MASESVPAVGAIEFQPAAAVGDEKALSRGVSRHVE